jgi:serine/threonine-protein kinase
MQDSEAGSLIGQALGEYLLRGLLGVGGMAEVYQAMDRRLEREVAVKVLPASLAADPSYVQRFYTEAKQVAALHHPHIVPIYAFGEERGIFYHVMPLLHGSLRDRLLKDGPLAPAEAVRLVCQIASALGAAHTLGLVHRDVKPENILLDAEGNALLTDFGIARELAVLRQAGVARTLAGTGMPVGTPEYMAPEQLRGEPCDQRADMYALGAVLYELLTGVAPHEADSPFEVAALVLSAPILPPSQRNPQVWPALEQALQQALALDPASRYSDMPSFAAALELALDRTDAVWPASMLPPVASGRRMGRLLSLALPLPAKLQQPRARVAAALALVLIAAALGTSFVVLRAAGNGDPSASDGGLPAALTMATATVTTGATATPATPQPTATPAKPATSATSQPTATPATPQPTATPATPQPTVTTPTPSPSPTPSPTLIMQPTPLVLRPSSQNANTCIATQTVINTTGQTVGWQWQQPQVGGFHFQINGGPMMDWPKDLQPGIAPGDTDTLTATSNCQPQTKYYPILLTDTPGDQYTFVLQLQ